MVNKIIKIIHYNYLLYLLIGILLVIPILIFGGFRGLKESYIDNNDLSYKRFKSSRKQYYKD